MTYHSPGARWARVEYIGTQPVIMQGQISQQRYTFQPGQSGVVDTRDVAWLTGLNDGTLFRAIT